VPHEINVFRAIAQCACAALISACVLVASCEVEEGDDDGTEAPAAASLDGMVVIPTGCFPMGARGQEGDDHERPQHTVQVGEFAIDLLPVSNVKYAAFLAEHGNDCPYQAFPYDCADCSAEGRGIDCGGSDYTVRDVCQNEPLGTGESPPEDGFTDSCAEHPVVEVSWFGASAYCASLNKRLPSEAEWARAANGPGGDDCSTWRRFPWGDDCPGEFHWEFFPSIYLAGCHEAAWTRATARANCVEGDCFDGFERTSPVGYFASGNSVEGVSDLSGNTSEWTADTYHNSYSGAPGDGSAWIPDGRGRVRRSTSYYLAGRTARSNYRVLDQPWRTWNFLGFRCAASAFE